MSIHIVDIIYSSNWSSSDPTIKSSVSAINKKRSNGKTTPLTPISAISSKIFTVKIEAAASAFESVLLYKADL